MMDVWVNVRDSTYGPSNHYTPLKYRLIVASRFQKLGLAFTVVKCQVKTFGFAYTVVNLVLGGYRAPSALGLLDARYRKVQSEGHNRRWLQVLVVT